MRRIAIYGKGGVGKSTIVSNLSASLALEGKKVLQVGCDPKHDSTRGLIHGARPATAVELLLKNRAEDIAAGNLLMKGFRGIDCVEVGGPEPGVGCAGLGIIKSLQLIQSLGIMDNGYDYVFFDVLGDVVCGGFATPMKMDFAREVYVVVSTEMMAMYAANNICRGILRYATTGHVRLGGFIGNLRGPGTQQEILEQFASRIGTGLIMAVPWSETILAAERRRMTVLEAEPDSEAAAVYRELAAKIGANSDLRTPAPMTDREFDDFISGI